MVPWWWLPSSEGSASDRLGSQRRAAEDRRCGMLTDSCHNTAALHRPYTLDRTPCERLLLSPEDHSPPDDIDHKWHNSTLIYVILPPFTRGRHHSTVAIWVQYDFWTINILCILAVVGYLQSNWKKELHSVHFEITILTDSFVHCMLCCSDSESRWWIQVSSWITSCEINFCWVTSVSFEKFFRSLCSFWC